MPDAATAEIEALFRNYCAAFEAFDAERLAGFFAYPCHIAGEADPPVLRSFAAAPEYVRTITQFLGLYRKAGVAAGDVLDMRVTPLSPRLARADLRWRVRGENAPLYEFDGVYTLVRNDGAWRIAAIAHNELPQLNAILAR